jgi:ribosome-associated protein
VPQKKKGRKSAAALAAEKKIRDAAIQCARIADERRATDIAVLHVEATIFVTDYFVITSARNKRQIQAIATDVHKYLRAEGFPARMEGYEEGSWVLIDSGSIVVHVFREDLRAYYDLEMLWGDAPKIDWKK